MGNLNKHLYAKQVPSLTNQLINSQWEIFTLPTRLLLTPLSRLPRTVASPSSLTSLPLGAHLASASVQSTRATLPTTPSLSSRSAMLTTTARLHRPLASRPCPPSRSTRTVLRSRPCVVQATRV